MKNVLNFPFNNPQHVINFPTQNARKAFKIDSSHKKKQFSISINIRLTFLNPPQAFLAFFSFNGNENFSEKIVFQPPSEVFFGDLTREKY
jgi:hypothetical protein